jgi:nicotinate-nucleotide adenylyltransferase
VRRLLFGGSFDPVHSGHISIAKDAARSLGAERVSLVPAAGAPHKRAGASATAGDRLEMCRRAVAGDALFDVLDVEIRRGGVSYTVDTLRELAAGPCAGDSLMLLVGQDQLAGLPQWKEAREIASLAPIAVVPRTGALEPPWDALEVALGREAALGIRARMLKVAPVTISSTDVRRRVAEGRSVRCWVPDPVADYIEERGLYRAG